MLIEQSRDGGTWRFLADRGNVRMCGQKVTKNRAAILLFSRSLLNSALTTSARAITGPTTSERKAWNRSEPRLVDERESHEAVKRLTGW
jgi:hypothetical protein